MWAHEALTMLLEIRTMLKHVDHPGTLWTFINIIITQTMNIICNRKIVCTTWREPFPQLPPQSWLAKAVPLLKQPPAVVAPPSMIPPQRQTTAPNLHPHSPHPKIPPPFDSNPRTAQTVHRGTIPCGRYSHYSWRGSRSVGIPRDEPPIDVGRPKSSDCD